MSEETFKNILVGSAIILLFTSLGLTFLIGMGNENNIDSSYLESDVFQMDEINDSLTDLQGNAENWREQFSDADPTFFLTIWKVVFNMFSFTKDVFDLIFVGFFHNILGIPSIVMGITLGVFIIVMLFALWRWWNSGN